MILPRNSVTARLCWPLLIAPWVLLGGCVGVTKVEPEMLSAADFRVLGKLAVRGGERPFSARFRWVQLASRFDLELWGPFGQGRRRFRGDRERLEVLDGRGVLLQVGSPTSLLRTNLGFTLPLDALGYWIQGRPSPDLPIEVRSPVSSAQPVERLEQAGWALNYDAWSVVGGVNRPEKIVIQGHGYEVRVALNW